MSTNQNPAPGAGRPPAPDYENKRQLAARLGVSVRTIDNLLVRGLPPIKLTRKLTRFPRVVRRAAVRRYAQARAEVAEWVSSAVWLNCGVLSGIFAPSRTVTK